MTSTPLIPAWSPDQISAFGREPVAYRHALLETGLFEDDALARQLERHPAELFDINLFDFDDAGQASLRTGRKGDRDGHALLAGVKAGRVWIQMRRIQDHYPE